MKVTTYFYGAHVFNILAGIFIITSFSNAFWAAGNDMDKAEISYQVGLWRECVAGNCTSMARSDNPGIKCM